jgi:hypothetical protein
VVDVRSRRVLEQVHALVNGSHALQWVGHGCRKERIDLRSQTTGYGENLEGKAPCGVALPCE